MENTNTQAYTQVSIEQWQNFCAIVDREIVKQDLRFYDCSVTFKGNEVSSKGAVLNFRLMRDCSVDWEESLVFDDFNCLGAYLFNENTQKKITLLWRKFLLSNVEGYKPMLTFYKHKRLKEVEEENQKRLLETESEFKGLTD